MEAEAREAKRGQEWYRGVAYVFSLRGGEVRSGGMRLLFLGNYLDNKEGGKSMTCRVEIKINFWFK